MEDAAHTVIAVELRPALGSVADERRELTVNHVGRAVVDEHFRHDTSPHASPDSLAVYLVARQAVNLPTDEVRERGIRDLEYVEKNIVGPLPADCPVAHHLRTSGKRTFERRSARCHHSHTRISHQTESSPVDNREVGKPRIELPAERGRTRNHRL